MLKKLIFLTLLTLSSPSFAERLFDVEIIVFKRNVNPDSINEKWADKQPNINFSNTVSLLSPSELKKHNLTLLPKNDYKLTNEYNRLAQESSFTPLYHVAWRQDDGNRKKMPKIRFTAGKNYQSQYFTDGSSKKNDYFTEIPLTEADESNKIDGPIFELDGYIRLYVQHYLFIETDLVLRKPAESQQINSPLLLEDLEIETVNNKVKQNSSFTMEEAPLTLNSSLTEKQTYSIKRFLRPYPLKQKRRMRSGETHYIDHPMLGFIIQVRRVN